MTKEQFENGMLKLSMLYNSFEFDVFPNDNYGKMKYDLWKKELDVIEDFERVVDYYVKTQDYAPNGTRSILKVYEEYQNKAKGVMSAEEAWELVRGRLKDYDIKGYLNSYGNYKNDFYASIRDENIKKACKEIESKLKDMTIDETSYVSHEFKLIYNRHVENESKQDVLKIGNDDKLKLE